MVYFTVRCEAVPGKGTNLDQFLATRSKPFWLSQTGVTGFHVYGDVLDGWPERTLMIEVEDLSSLQRILDSPERKQLRGEFMGYVARVESQITEQLISERAESRASEPVATSGGWEPD
ncbi:MAG: hypothetical protein HY684_00815 [Chloroflexi bacterium]|nr:hypothetical protein [Chloroflexota bacterium]